MKNMQANWYHYIHCLTSSSTQYLARCRNDVYTIPLLNSSRTKQTKALKYVWRRVVSRSNHVLQAKTQSSKLKQTHCWKLLSLFKLTSAWWRMNGDATAARHKWQRGLQFGSESNGRHGSWWPRTDHGTQLPVPKEVNDSVSPQSRQDARPEWRTRWKTCSRRMSCKRLFRSLTLCTISAILPWSSLSILLVAPIAMSKVSFTFGPPDIQPPWTSGMKQILCWPASAAVKVKRPDCGVRCETTRWCVSNVSSTVRCIFKFWSAT